ncbi:MULTISPECIES: DNA gyrase subunit A [unclassified Gemella]|uniref:DNA gyrase subunit A n=1 Tax=unclassified Gemella TaxID=2624949 RepID=UPI001C05A69F|nr:MULTISPECIES: DNA gyrase subunit A [unclassified Gemella]MBU0278092.1 DNA gyrase subunit A [Gemella sp. zg-1178]QWQ38382.1 DNA gyrase subunit A [Gemella sp. zg-570]
MEDKNITLRNITTEIENSFLDYSMSVIVSRALPDVRDGLKPVHRRVLYAFNELGLTHDKPFRKSATVVGEVMGKYHPHGDSATYGTIVRLAQDFNSRYPMVAGQGNFGSIDGDSAAAMRYTEAKLSKIAAEMVRDINKETVDYQDNYDGSTKEPKVLPARIPNLLVNGGSGIAVGMATNIPPHHLGEVIDGVIALADNSEISIPELMTKIKGPDFPTRALILGESGISKAYHTGRGSIIMRGKTKIEQMKNGKERIIISEIPYQVNKAKLVEKIAELARDKKIEGITDLRDESNLKEGIRIVIELRRDSNSNVILNNLFKLTPLQSSFGVNMVALVNGKPKTLNLKEVLYHYLEHQKEVIVRRTRYDLKKAQDRAHILEGLRIALDNIDRIIELIRASKTTEEARNELMVNFNLSELQAQAILDMRLQRLTGLERYKIEDEYNKLIELIKDLIDVLNNDDRVLQIIKDELLEIKEKYKDARRSIIVEGQIDEIENEDLIEREQIVITLSYNQYIKRLAASTYKSQGRGGRGINGMTTNDEDNVEYMLTCSTHDHILFFTDRGKVYTLKGYEINQMSRQAKGIPIINLLEIDKDEKVNSIIAISDLQESDTNLVFVTKYGIIKKSNLADYASIMKKGKIALKLDENDTLIEVQKVTKNDDIMIVTAGGQAIRINEDKVRQMGRVSRGVKGITLALDDYVVGMQIINKAKKILTVTENGIGKISKENEFRVTNRGGKGIKVAKISKKTGKIVSVKSISGTEDLMIMTDQGIIIRIDISVLNTLGRTATGVKLINLVDGQKVATVTLAEKEEILEEN